ncbi:MAG: hypothetical protein MIO88_01350, partial [Methanoregulaceae archaeon]|nr:hypothetical protein [Methanoregulaceae archaeon]
PPQCDRVSIRATSAQFQYQIHFFVIHFIPIAREFHSLTHTGTGKIAVTGRSSRMASDNARK